MKALFRVALVLSLQGLFLSNTVSAAATVSTTGTANSPSAATTLGRVPLKALPSANGPAVKDDTPVPATDKPPAKQEVPDAAAASQAPCDVAEMQCAANKCSSAASSSAYSACLSDECHVVNAACVKSLGTQSGN
jgi:hypothetical protein